MCIFMEMQGQKKKSRRALLSPSVLQKVQNNLDGPPLMAHYVISVQDGVVVDEEVASDLRADFLRYYNIKLEHPLSDDKVWDETSRNRFRQTYNALRGEVVLGARILAVTPVVAASTEVRQNFGQRPDSRGIGRMDDEAGTMSEAEALVPATGDFGHLISLWMSFGDRRQTGVNPIAGNGTNNTLNEFLEQASLSLLDRLVRTGHSAIQLIVQNRMHKTLFEPANEIHYDCSIMTDSSRNAPLQEKSKQVMATVQQCRPNGSKGNDGGAIPHGVR